MRKQRLLPTFRQEYDLGCDGYRRIAGVDEAGRGALAGPVVAAAVVLPPEFTIDGVRDSKLIPEPERESLYAAIVEGGALWSVGVVDSGTIDSINILQSTFRAMRSAVAGLASTPDFVLIDGRDQVDVGPPCRAVIGGDGLSISIAAASIIAKVTRDRIMRKLHDDDPRYHFDRNKGYGTPAHRFAIRRYGPSPVHRSTFLRNVMQLSLAEDRAREE